MTTDETKIATVLTIVLDALELVAAELGSRTGAQDARTALAAVARARVLLREARRAA